MKALRFHASRDLRVEDVDVPEACGPHEVLLKNSVLQTAHEPGPLALKALFCSFLAAVLCRAMPLYAVLEQAVQSLGSQSLKTLAQSAKNC